LHGKKRGGTHKAHSMICFEVSLNGKPIARVGHTEAGTLVAVLEATPSVQAVGLKLTGELPSQGDNAVFACFSAVVGSSS
jgi:hypothetical protein